MAAFYGFRAAPFVGWLNDDACYILHALGLAKGTYWNLSSPQPTIDQFWPGYPIFLTPLVALLKPHWELLRLSSLALLCCAGFFFSELTKNYFSFFARLLLLAVFVFHPLTIKTAGQVISEPLFTALVLAYFLLLDRELAFPDLKKKFALIFLLAWIVLTRPTGIPLFLSTLIIFLKSPRWKEALYITLGALPLCLAYPLWVAANTHQAVAYVSLWQDTAHIFLSHFFDHAQRIFYFFFCHTLLGVQWPHRGVYLLLSDMVILISVFFCGLGFLGARKRYPQKWRILCAMASFIVGYIAIHLFYLSIDERYFWPLLPFLAIFFLVGIKEGFSALRMPSTLYLPLGLLWCLVLFKPDALLLHAALLPSPPAVKVPEHTLSWIRNHIPAGTLCIGRQPLLYVLTGVRGEYTLDTYDREEFLFKTLDGKYAYVILFANSINMPLPTYPGQGGLNLLSQNAGYMTYWRERYIPIYQNTVERTQILKVAPDEAFQKAYRLYLDASSELSAGHGQEAKEALDQSLALYPKLAASWMAYGILNYVQADYKSAEVKLTRALAINPDNILANEYMARVLMLQRHNLEAKGCYKKAIALIEYSGSYSELLPMLRQELSKLD